MTLAAIAVLGLQAYSRLPAELTPRADVPTLTVTTIYPGAGPPEIETQISKPLEEAIGTVGGVQNLYSSSQANVSILSIDFAAGTNLEAAIAEARGRIEAIRGQLPPEAQPPVVAKLDINAQPILQLGFESESRTSQQLRALMDNVVKPRLERVSGVATVQVVGGEQREIQVNVDSARLAQYGLTIADVVNSLKASGRDIPGGGIAQGERETQVRLAGAFTSLNALRNTQLLAPQLAQFSARLGPPNPDALPSPPLTVADVATVTDGRAEHQEIHRINGREGVSLLLTKASDANTVAVADQVYRALEELRPRWGDTRYTVLRDDAVTVRDALEDVNFSLILGAVLAMGVIFLFLHNLRGTLIVSIAIPACVVATFLVIGMAGFTLNQMTLLALSLSVGILVDDSIVVLESITRHLRHGEEPYEAALNGRAEIGFADVTTTLVDVVVFVPIAFMGGVVGGFFKQFGLTIATATLFSLVVSFSITPMLAARWYRKGEDMETRRGLFAVFERMYRRWEARYRRVLRVALRHRLLVIFGGVATLALLFWVSFGRLGTDLVPGVDQGLLTVRIEMPPGSSLAATDAVARRIEEIVRKKPEMQSVVTTVGRIVGGFGTIPQQGAQFAQINARLHEKHGRFDWLLHPGGSSEVTRARSDAAIAAELRGELQPIAKEVQGKIAASAKRSIEGVSVPIEIQLSGPDLEQLTQVMTQVRDLIAGVPGVLDPDTSVRSGQPELRAEIDRRRAAQMGVPEGLAGDIVRASLAGNTETVLREDGEEVPVRARLAEAERDNPARVGEIVVGSQGPGQPILLSDIATLHRRAGPTNIDRLNGQRSARVTASVAPGVALSTARQEIEKRLKSALPPDMTWSWGGEGRTVDENAVYFARALILAILLVYFVMASLFNSLGTPFVIMFTLPMALIGALGALVLTGETLSLVSAIGVIMLVGLMGRNAILLLDYTNTLRTRGLARSEAIEEAGATRLRPILMTTIATIAGMLPIALRIGRASELRAPMAIVVIGGLLVSTVLTLVVIPVLYSLFDDWFGAKARPEAAPEEYPALQTPPSQETP